jgi:hypothetical protein
LKVKAQELLMSLTLCALTSATRVIDCTRNICTWNYRTRLNLLLKRND